MIGFSIKGNIKIMKYLKGKLIEKYEYENLITDIGKETILKLIGGDNTSHINKIAFGSGTNAAKYSDRQLQSKIYLADVSKDYSIPNRINFLSIIPENTFTQIVNYNEAGLVHKNINSEILISRVVFDDTIYQKPENSLSFIYSLELRV